MDRILKENDLRIDKDIYLIDVINSYYNRKFFRDLIEDLSEKVGRGDSHVGFAFWDNLDDYDRSFYDAPFNGVEVVYLSDTQRYSLQDLYYYVNLAAQRYIELKPNDKDVISEILAKMKINFRV